MGLIDEMEVMEEMKHWQDEIMNDCPDEFVDQMFCVVMKNPVTLFGTHYERTSIEKHILNHKEDPLTRAPCTMEDLVPDEEL